MNLIAAGARSARDPLRVPGLIPGLAYANSAPTVADVKNALDAIQKTFADFKAQNDKELAERLKKGDADVVTKEHTDRINAEITALQNELKELNTKLALSSLGKTDSDKASPEVAAYASAFRNYVASGDGERELHNLAVKAMMTTDSKPDGGYLVPTEMETAITRVVGIRSAMRGLARVVSIGTDTFTKPHNLGGATSGWVSEKQSRTQTQGPQLSELEFVTNELYAMPAATQKLLDDSRIDIAAWLAEEIAIKFAEDEGAAFVDGDGNKKPRGFLAQTIVANGSYAWGKIGYKPSGVAAALSDETHNGGDALIDLIHSLNAAYRANASFMMNDLTLAAVRKLKDGEDNYLWQPSMQAGVPSQLLGYSVISDDNMPDIGAGEYPIAFADWNRGYLIVDRMGVRVLRDPYSSKPYVLFYTTKRVGGNVQDFAAIKVLKIATS
jgi:HK97 family phage major capsid protein